MAEAVALKHGDLIQVGAVSITFLFPADASVPSKPAAEPTVLPLIEDPWEVWRDQPTFELPKSDTPAPPAAPDPEEVVAPSGLKWRWNQWRAEVSARALERDALKESQRLQRESKRRQADLEERRLEAAHRLAVEAEWQKRFAEGRRNLEHESFRGVMIHQIRNSPFLLISLAFHVVIAILLSLSTVTHREKIVVPPFDAFFDKPIADLTPELQEDLTPLEKPPEVLEAAEDDLPEPDFAPAVVDQTKDQEEELEKLKDTEMEFRPGDSTAGLAEGLGLNPGGDRGLKLGGTQFRKYVQTLRKHGFEVVVAIDSTGSMGSVLADTRREVDRILLTLGTLIPGFRLGVVTYRDANEDYVTKGADLTNSWYKAVAFLDDIRAGGGGDSPEAVLEGLKHAIHQMQWTKGSKKVVILVGDAPYHDRDKKELEALLRAFAKSGGVVHTLTTGNHGRQLMQSVQSAFQQVAHWGSGTCTNLKDSDELAKVLLTLAIGGEHKSDLVSAMHTLESSPAKVRAARLANTGTPDEIFQSLRGNQIDQLLLRELMQSSRPENIPAYLMALSDKEVPLPARWAITVILRRTLLAREGSDSMYADAMRLSPDLPIERNQSLIDSILSAWNQSKSRKKR